VLQELVLARGVGSRQRGQAWGQGQALARREQEQEQVVQVQGLVPLPQGPVQGPVGLQQGLVGLPPFSPLVQGPLPSLRQRLTSSVRPLPSWSQQLQQKQPS